MAKIKEIWKPIVGYEGLYEASNLGRIISLPKTMNGKNCSTRVRSSYKILSACVDKSTGYIRVVLANNRKHKTHYVHRLVIDTFSPVGPYDTRFIKVDHINGIKTDNRIENLRRVSARENSSKDRKPSGTSTVGVIKLKKTGKFQARSFTSNGFLYLGNFETEKEASEAYNAFVSKADEKIYKDFGHIISQPDKSTWQKQD